MNLKTLTRDLACDRIELFAAEGRLVQNGWHMTDADGRELACLLGAIDPDVDGPEKCPGTVMPPWVAHLLPTLFDGVREERALDYGMRFARALRSGNTDESVMRRFLIVCVENAISSATPKGDPPAYWTQVSKACADVVALLKKGSLNKDKAAAARAAWAAWTAEAAAAAAWTAEAAAAAAWAARTAAEAAEAAAWKAAAAAWAAWAARTARAQQAGSEQYERLFDALLDAMT
jgi:hypothetical protein